MPHTWDFLLVGPMCTTFLEVSMHSLPGTYCRDLEGARQAVLKRGKGQIMTTSAELESFFCQLTLPAGDVAQLVRELIDKPSKYQGEERRGAARYPLACPVVVVPIDEQETLGEAFAAITRDISSSGISIYHTRPVHDPYLAIQWTERGQLQVLVEVVRCRPVGLSLYEIGCRFVIQPAE